MKPEIERSRVHDCAIYVLRSLQNEASTAGWHLACMRQVNETGLVSHTHDILDTNQLILGFWEESMLPEPGVNDDDFALFAAKVFNCVHAFMCTPGFRL